MSVIFNNVINRASGGSVPASASGTDRLLLINVIDDSKFVTGVTIGSVTAEVAYIENSVDETVAQFFIKDASIPATEETITILGASYARASIELYENVDQTSPIAAFDSVNPAGTMSGVIGAAGDMVSTVMFWQQSSFPVTPTNYTLATTLQASFSNRGASAYKSVTDTSDNVIDWDDSLPLASCSGYVILSRVVSGPTITGPDSTTDGTATQATGTDLDTITTFSLISGTYAVEQTIDGQTATTLDYVANSGVNDCVPGTPVAGVPLEATITAPGITPYVVQQEADDGVNPAATRDITLNAPATHDVVQTMIATANTIDDQSIFGTSWIDVEDNMQAYVPKVVDGVNFTWAADGTFTTDQDKTVNVRVAYLAPSTLQYGCIDFTIQGSTIISFGMITEMIKPMISNMIEDM